ncbi:MAG TPA: hypothetical protein VLM40_00415, partial [Gemmata sp.]|nr:hypothetical protein [Gemmata sp.]
MPPAEAHGGNATSSSTLRGEVIYLYAFDVASEIQLERLPDLLACQPSTPLAETGASGRAVPRSVPLARPVSIEIPPITSRMKGEQIRVQARVYEVGVITITVRLTVAGQSLAEFHHFHEPVLDDGQPLDRFARSQCIEIRRKIASAMIRSEPETEPEAYTVFAFSQLANSRDVNSWLAEHSREVAGLLTATAPDRLSEAQVAEVLRLKRSFENTDLVVLDWDAALVVELEGPIDEVLFVLDLANLQLEEFRWM